eukprot:SAG31_NODE_27650_length_422_cov_1.235294_1_plen_86_part_10
MGAEAVKWIEQRTQEREKKIAEQGAARRANVALRCPHLRVTAPAAVRSVQPLPRAVPLEAPASHTMPSCRFARAAARLMAADADRT